MTKINEDEKHKRSVGRTLIFLAIIYTCFVVVFEVGARGYYWVSDGFNPYFLTYGFVPDSEWNSAELDGYTKFQPSTVRHQQVDGHTISMEINGDGFRGKDFQRPKSTGTLRVVTLGASSTFGYYNEDHQTYPVQLESLLEAELGRPVEVLNLGIPELRLNNILALAKAELPSLEPDVVTLYAGANNAIRTRDRSEAGLLYRMKDGVASVSIGWRAVAPLVRNGYYLLTRVLNRDVAGLPSVHTPVVMGSEEIAALVANGRQEYRADLEELFQLVEGLGAQPVIATQSFAPKNYVASDHLMEWRDYWDEVAYFEHVVATDGGLDGPLTAILVHAGLMREMQNAAKERGLPVVPGIQILDGDRESVMASFVHLTPAGNRLLAEAFAHEITRELERGG